MSETKNIAPMKLEMLLAVVHEEKMAYYSSLIQSHQANFQFNVSCKGTTHLMLGYLGLTDRPKNLLMSVVRSDQAGDLMETLKENFAKGKNYKGVAFTIPFSSMIGTVAYGFLSNERRVME